MLPYLLPMDESECCERISGDGWLFWVFPEPMSVIESTSGVLLLFWDIKPEVSESDAEQHPNNFDKQFVVFSWFCCESNGSYSDS